MADTLLKVRVQPGSSRNEVVGKRDGAVIVRVTAAPTDGKANTAACKLLAELDDGALAELSTGRAKRLRADGAPRDLRVVSISRAE